MCCEKEMEISYISEKTWEKSVMRVILIFVLSLNSMLDL